MTPVNTVAFTVQAKDADDDTIIYSIDQASVSTIKLFLKYRNKRQTIPNLLLMCLFLQPDAEYFRIDLPNSGEVILSKPLDYETKTLLTVTVYAAVCTLHF